MELLKLLKKSRELNFEALLAKAPFDPACELTLLDTILSQKLILITFDNFLTDGYHMVEKETRIDIYTYINGQVPVFSSTEKIFDNTTDFEKVKFVALDGRTLFTILKDKTIILNPNSKHSREFGPKEIELLLSGEKKRKLEKQLKLVVAK